MQRMVTLSSSLRRFSTALEPFQWHSAKPPWISGRSGVLAVK
jgi:hypothetical protein